MKNEAVLQGCRTAAALQGIAIKKFTFKLSVLIILYFCELKIKHS